MNDAGLTSVSEVIGFSQTTGQGAGIAYLIGSIGDDTLTSSQTTQGQNASVATLVAAGVTMTVNGNIANYIYGQGGNDTATIFADLSPQMMFYGLPTYSIVQCNFGSQLVFEEVVGFAQVLASGRLGGTDAIRPGDDTLTGAVGGNGGFTDALLSDPGYSVRAYGFAKAYSIASAGGMDTATIDGCQDDDLFYGMDGYSALVNNIFLNQAQGFDFVHANLITTTGNDVAVLSDGPGNDQFTARGSYAELLYASGNRVRVTAFDTVYAQGFNGGTNSRNVTNPLSYTLVFVGTWV